MQSEVASLKFVPAIAHHSCLNLPATANIFGNPIIPDPGPDLPGADGAPFVPVRVHGAQMVFRRMTVPIHGIAFIMNLLMYPLITQSLSDIGPAIRKLA